MNKSRNDAASARLTDSNQPKSGRPNTTSAQTNPVTTSGAGRIILKLLVLISFLLMVLMNTLANVLPINGVTTGSVSDSYANLFAPAGFTLSIWGIIYLLLALFTIYQFVADRKVSATDASTVQVKQSDQASDDMKKTRSLSYTLIWVFFVLSSLINTVWILAWHYNRIGWSLVLMIGLLLCLILIHSHVNKFKGSITRRERLLTKLPFSVYFGWITVATVANVTTWLVAIDWQGWGISDEIWTVIAIVAATLIALLVIARSKDAAYALVILWALTGIVSKHLDNNGFNSGYPAVIVTTSITMAAVAAAMLLAVFGKRIKLISTRKSKHAR